MCYHVHMSTHTEIGDTASTTLTVRLPATLKDRLGKLAEQTRRTKSFLAAEAIARYVGRELEIVAGIERGLDDMKAGRVVPHEDVVADIEATIKKAKTRRPKR